MVHGQILCLYLLLLAGAAGVRGRLVLGLTGAGELGSLLTGCSGMFRELYMYDVRKLGLLGSESVRFSMTSLVLHQQLHSVIQFSPPPACTLPPFCSLQQSMGYF
jgi:hypothetical protein